MTDILNGARLLVADDQPDVARTLCGNLLRAGAKIRYSPDGQAAAEAIERDVFDLIIVDMKMPPQEWGGLWLLEHLAEANNGIPTLVLSGEGLMPQVVKALRLGARDWIAKDDASNELADACKRLLSERMSSAPDQAAEQLPTPIAFRLARYIRATSLETRVTEGLHTLVAVLRFAAQVALVATPPAPIPGLKADRLRATSMGTWRDIAFELHKREDMQPTAKRIISWLVPDKAERETVNALVQLRNDISHGRGRVTRDIAANLDLLLRKFSHRALCESGLTLAIATSMRYDGKRYAVDAQLLRGITPPSPMSILSTQQVINGSVLLTANGGDPIDLTPLLVSAPSSTDMLRCLQFDSLERPGRGSPEPILRYLRCDDGADDVTPPLLTWPALSQWTTDQPTR
jgi:CheY-like chemotaxis protein